MGITLNDCAVVCWNSKWHYNTERPEHFIKDVIDPTWESQLDHPYTGTRGVTPAFPAYPSGHSTFGGGGAFALAAIWETITPLPTDVTKTELSLLELLGRSIISVTLD